MKISVIIPCYNVANYLKRCIESVLNQTYSNFELILVDDGSIDETSMICKLYLDKDNRVQYYCQSNQGVSSARNLGIQKASGDKIMFIDADDYVAHDILTTLVASIKEKDNLVIPICGINHVKKGEILANSNYRYLIENNFFKLNNNEILTLFKYENLSTPCCKLYDTTLVKHNNIYFRENITYQEDLIFNLDYFKYINTILIVPKFSYFYIENETSSSIKYHKSLFDSLPILFLQLQSFEDFKKTSEDIKLFFMNQILNNLNNVNHLSSNLSYIEKYNKLKMILNSDIYNFCKTSLEIMRINFMLKFLIRFKIYTGIIFFYKMYRIIK